MGLDLKKRGFAKTVLGVEKETVNAEAALRLGLADEITSYEECLKRSDVVVVSVPVGAAVKMLPDILDHFKEEGGEDKIVIDTCSTKEQVVRSVRYHSLRARYVATHPMAGTEYSGP